MMDHVGDPPAGAIEFDAGEAVAALEPVATYAVPAVSCRLKCGYCGTEDAVPDAPEKSIYTCDDCGARTAYGVSLPKVFILPHPDDRRFLVTRYDLGPERGDATFALDREFATKVALEVLSVTDPEMWKRALGK